MYHPERLPAHRISNSTDSSWMLGLIVDYGIDYFADIQEHIADGAGVPPVFENDISCALNAVN